MFEKYVHQQYSVRVVTSQAYSEVDSSRRLAIARARAEYRNRTPAVGIHSLQYLSTQHPKCDRRRIRGRRIDDPVVFENAGRRSKHASPEINDGGWGSVGRGDRVE